MAVATVISSREQHVMEWLTNSYPNNPDSSVSSKSSKSSSKSRKSNNQSSQESQSSNKSMVYELPYSPHYDPGSSSDSDIIIETPFDPHDLTERMEYCAVCYSRYATPTETVKCVRRHKKHLCYFCFESLDCDRLNVTRHYRKKGHFCDETEYLVKCPYPECAHLDKKYSFIFQIQKHILKEHLPKEYLVPEIEPKDHDKDLDSDAPKTRLSQDLDSDPIEIKKCDRYPIRNRRNTRNSNKNVDDNDKTLDGCDSKKDIIKFKEDVIDECLKFEKTYDKMQEELVRAVKSQHRKIDAKTEEDATMIHEEDHGNTDKSNLTNPVELKGNRSSFYACSFCDKVFFYREGLTNHSVQRKCPMLQTKWCSGCNYKFKGFSLLDCVIHLLTCPKSHRIQSGKRPKWSKRRKQVVFK